MTFHIKEHQICQKSKLKHPKKFVFVKKTQRLNLQGMAVLMTLGLEIKCHIIPPLKALTRSMGKGMVELLYIKNFI